MPLGPTFCNQKLAKSFGVASHNLNISSFSKHKELAAEFIWFIHTKDRMKAMYEIAGAICPDTRFDQSWLTTKVDMKIQKWILERQKFWYQLYYPLMLESDAVIPAVQNIFAQRWTPEQAGQKMDEVIKKWRKMSPKEVDIFKGWYPFINE